MAEAYIKFLLRQDTKMQKRFLETLEKIKKWDLDALDIKTMKGQKNSFRCRVGKFRIIFSKQENGSVRIIDIDSRGDIY